MGIIEFFKWLWETFERHFLPFTVIHIYERGIRLVWGKKPKLLQPGFHWKWPFAHEVFTEVVTPDTICPQAIHITTMDNKTISIEPTVEIEIIDVEKYIIWTNQAESNIRDIVRFVATDYYTDCTWDECKTKTSRTEIKNKLNKRCEEMGVKVNNYIPASMCMSRIYITQM